MSGRSRKYGKKSKRIGHRRTRKLGHKRTRKLGQTKRMVKRRGKRTRRSGKRTRRSGGGWVVHDKKWIREEEIPKEKPEPILNAIKIEGYNINMAAYEEIVDTLADDIESGVFLSNLTTSAEIYHSTNNVMPFIEALKEASNYTGIPIFHSEMPEYGESEGYARAAYHSPSPDYMRSTDLKQPTRYGYDDNEDEDL
jgi:hypothetical protein